jgi:hypothetical protein
MIEGGLAGDLNHATRQSVMIEGGLAGDLNHATRQT